MLPSERSVAWIPEERREKKFSWEKKLYFSFVKTLLRNISAGFTICRVWRWLIFAPCSKARLWSFRRLNYNQGEEIPACGKNKHLLDASRRISFYGEVASKWFGSYFLSWFSGIILTSSPYPLQPIKGEEISWRKLAWAWLGVGLSLGKLSWLEWF